MIDLVGVHRLDEAQVVGDFPQVGQPLADGRAGLAAPLELGRAGLDELALTGGHGGQTLSASHGLGQFGPGQVGEARLVVEELDLRGSARLREEDHAFGLGGEVGQGGQSGLLRLGGRARGEGAEGHRAERKPRLLDEGATWKVEGVHGQASFRSRTG